jgi:branched-chain amino acid aminotransferase
MAARWAKNMHCNDAVVLNVNQRIADTTLSNIFILLDGSWRTPPLSEGPINGVMRRYLLSQLKKDGIPVEELPLTPEDLDQAQEIILTNVMSGIRWVKSLGNNHYTGTAAAHLYYTYIRPLWNK